jgi:glycosyltransferase involved in cell wall biosynthesis
MSVQVLLSTYNGERYLKPLLQSLLAQDYYQIQILIRDDGSTDNTAALLRQYAAARAEIEVDFGQHIGFVQSFSNLIAMASRAVDYIALCDQDDVWKPEKISRAVAFLNRCPPNLPALYCSRAALVNHELKLLGYSAVPKKGLSFRNALVENRVLGCTTLFNAAALRLLTGFPAECVSHDWWIYLVISAFGIVFYDPQPKVLYRQHPANVFGMSAGAIERWKTKVRAFRLDGKSRLIVRQAEEFLRIYGPSLETEQKKIVERFLNSRRRVWPRLRYALSCDVYRQSLVDHCILKARIAMDRL